MPSVTLAGLPDEILALIVRGLDPLSVVSLHATSKRFTDLVKEPLLWRHFCRHGFRYWNRLGEHRAALADPLLHDWKDIYVQRRRNFDYVLRSIRSLIEEPIGRTDRVQAIVDGGYNAKDALIHALTDVPSSPNFLAQRYWSWVVLGCLHRTIALEEWRKIRYRNDVENPIEHALAALDMFILDRQEAGDIDDTFDRLNSYAESVREAYPDIDDQTPRQKAIDIADHLRSKMWVGIENGTHYHSLDNIFLGVALQSPQRNSLPLISAVIYCYVCRQFGLQAQPCSFPLHVHCVVQPPAGIDVDGNSLPASSSQATTNTTEHLPRERTHLYMDPFNTSEPVPISKLEQQLRFMGPALQPYQKNMSLEPATHRDLLLRTANNILVSVTNHPATHTYPIDIESAHYAARFAIATFPGDPVTQRTNLKDLTQMFLHTFDQDIHIFRNYIMPLTSRSPDHLAYRNLSAQLLHAELERPLRKFRTNSRSLSSPLGRGRYQVRYKIGQVFRHKRRGYLAVIYGWDKTCEMSPQWITMNNVDSLPNGREQPFYNVYVADDSSTRYVAQENILLCGNGGGGENARCDSQTQQQRNEQRQQQDQAATLESSDSSSANNTTTTTNGARNESEVVETTSEPAVFEPITQHDIDAFGIQVGKWFRRFDYEQGVFVSNIRHEYPED